MKTELRTDSQYAQKAMTEWMPRWEQNGWKTSSGKDVAHQDLLRDIKDLSQSREFDGGVKFTHTRGHAGDPGNERADNLANQAFDD